jgi:glycerol-3-phosphate dehydrogenase subunit C
VQTLAEGTRDVAQYIVEIAGKDGLTPGLNALDGGVTLHVACHARAQNMGLKAAEMLRLIPGIDLKVIDRCSGHGGAWGVKKSNFDAALKIGRPAAKQALKAGNAHVASECPLAGMHLLQCMDTCKTEGDTPPPEQTPHPIELLAKSYGLCD